MHSVRFAKVVRRSIHLTPFGEDFCRTCLVDEDAAAAAPFPAAREPPEPEARRQSTGLSRRSRG